MKRLASVTLLLLLIGASCLPGETSTKFNVQEQVLPYFVSLSGEEISGIPIAVKELSGRAVLEFRNQDGSTTFVSPLAIKSDTWLEHPAEKLIRLKYQYDLKMELPLEIKLRSKITRDRLFQTITFEHLPGNFSKGVVSQINIDGSLIVRTDLPPAEWRRSISPNLFLISRKGDRTHEAILNKNGYRFQQNLLGETRFQKIETLLKNWRGASLQTSYWVTHQIRSLGVELDKDIKLLSRFSFSNNEDAFYFTATDGYPQSTKGIYYKLEENGTLTEILRTPGSFLFLMPHPYKENAFLVSAEGYPKDDQRFQSLFELNLKTGEWEVIKFPLPESFELYVSSGRIFGDTLVLKRYGFIEEGGGLWSINLNEPNYYTKTYLVEWDHMLTWLLLPTEDPNTYTIVITAKEVNDNFAMTANTAKLTVEGDSVKVSKVKRISTLAGWNPIPILIEKTGENTYLVYVQSNSFEAYIKGDPAAIYTFEVISKAWERR